MSKYLSPDGLAHLIATIKNNRSHVGMIVYSTTLNTQAKVIQQYGGTAWTQIKDTVLVACGDNYKFGSTVITKDYDMPLVVTGELMKTPNYKPIYVWERTK